MPSVARLLWELQYRYPQPGSLPTYVVFQNYYQRTLQERTRATSIGQMFNALGVRKIEIEDDLFLTQVGVSFLLGTMVESVDNGDLKKVESDISLLVYLYAGVAIVITALILAYFPR